MARFLRLTKEALMDEVDILATTASREATASGPEAGDWQTRCLQTIAVHIYYYEKLLLLRSGNPESWDEIDELYVHD